MRTGNINLMLGASIQNFRPEVLDTDPAIETLVAAQTARLWFNSTEKKYKFYDGTEIKALGEGGGSLEGLIKADGTVAMTADLVLSGPDQSTSADNAAVSKKHVETVVATKQDKISGLTENAVVIAGADSELQSSNVTSVELGHLSGVTSGIQGQFTTLDGKIGTVQTGLTGKLDAANGTLTGDLNADDNKITNLAAPENANDAARKIDIDNAIAGIDWLQDVDAIQEDGTLDPELVAGKRYLILSADTINPNFGSITGLTDNMIVQYSGTAFEIKFDPTNPEAGGAVAWVKAIKEYRRFDGTVWTTFGGTSDFNPGNGLEKAGNVVNVKTGAGIEITGNAVTAKLDAAGGLEDNAGATRVKLDGATLVRSADGLAVKDGGIGYTQIAAAALGTGLKQDVDNSKIIVDVAAVKTAGGFIDATGGAVEALTLTGTDPLTDDSVVSKKFVEDAIAAGSGGGAAKLYVYDKTGSEDVAATTHTFAHNANEKFGTVTVFDDTGYQIIPDEVVLIDANSLRVELTQAKKVAIAFVTGPKPNGSTDPEEPVEPEHYTVLVSSGNQVTGANNAVFAFLQTDKMDDIESITWTQAATSGNINRVTAQCMFVPQLDTTTLSNLIEAGSAGTITATIKLKDVVEPLVRTAPYSFPESPSKKVQVAIRTDEQWNNFELKSSNIKAGETHSFALVSTNGSGSASGSDMLSTANVVAKLGLDADDTVKAIEWRLDAKDVAKRETTLVSTGVITPSTIGYRANVKMPNYPDSATSTGIKEAYFLTVVFETTKGKRFIDQIALGMTVAAGSGSTTPSAWTGEELTAA